MEWIGLLILGICTVASLYLWYVEFNKKKHLQKQVRYWKKAAHRSPAGELLLYPQCKVYDQDDHLLEEAVDIYKVINQDDTITIILKQSEKSTAS